VRPGSMGQTPLTVIQSAAGVGLTIPACTLGGDTVVRFRVVNPIPTVPADSHAFIAAIVAGLFAFGGWHMVTYAAEETIEPEKTLPRALVLGVLIVTASYIALNAAYFHVLPP